MADAEIESELAVAPEGDGTRNQVLAKDVHLVVTIAGGEPFIGLIRGGGLNVQCKPGRHIKVRLEVLHSLVVIGCGNEPSFLSPFAKALVFDLVKHGGHASLQAEGLTDSIDPLGVELGGSIGLIDGLCRLHDLLEWWERRDVIHKLV